MLLPSLGQYGERRRVAVGDHLQGIPFGAHGFRRDGQMRAQAGHVGGRMGRMGKPEAVQPILQRCRGIAVLLAQGIQAQGRLRARFIEPRARLAGRLRRCLLLRQLIFCMCDGACQRSFHLGHGLAIPQRRALRLQRLQLRV